MQRRNKRKQKEEAKQREDEAKQKLAKKLKKHNEPIEAIIIETSLFKEDIDKL